MTKITNTDYNGWKNRQTWNVMLHINNDYSLYQFAVEFMSTYQGRNPYKYFIKCLGLENCRTPDRIKWYSNILDYPALNEAMQEFKS